MIRLCDYPRLAWCNRQELGKIRSNTSTAYKEKLEDSGIEKSRFSIRNKIIYAFINGIKDYVENYGGKDNLKLEMPVIEIRAGDILYAMETCIERGDEKTTKRLALDKLNSILINYGKEQVFLDTIRNSLDELEGVSNIARSFHSDVANHLSNGKIPSDDYVKQIIR